MSTPATTDSAAKTLRLLIEKWQVEFATMSGLGQSVVRGCIDDATAALRRDHALAPWTYVIRVETPGPPLYLAPSSTRTFVPDAASARRFPTKPAAEQIRATADRIGRATVERFEEIL